MTGLSEFLKRQFPTLAALPVEDLMMLPLIVVMGIGLFAGGLKLLIVG